MLFVLAICLCFTAFGAAFAETAVTEASAAEAPAAEAPKAEMTGEELFQAGLDTLEALDFEKALEYLHLAAEAGYKEAWSSIGVLYEIGVGVE